MKQPHMLLLGLSVLLLNAVPGVPCAAQPGPADGDARVVIIGVDGLSPDGIRQAETPHLDALLKQGAHTMQARAVMPTSSSPNWASMLMAAGPEQHGITSNDWEPDSFALGPVCRGTTVRFPTIFDELRRQQPRAASAVFHDWDGFGRLVEPEAPDTIADGDGPEATVRTAMQYVRAKKPRLTFIHLDHVDLAGHAHGHGTPAYYAAVAEADRLIGAVMNGLREDGQWQTTTLLLTSDHGGKEKGHGGDSPEEVLIPWILVGPGVRPGVELSAPVDTYDTAATAAYVLGLRPHACWIGKPVRAAFAEASPRSAG